MHRSHASALVTSMLTAYGSNIQPNCKSHGVKSLDLQATGRLWLESGTHGMGCGVARRERLGGILSHYYREAV